MILPVRVVGLTERTGFESREGAVTLHRDRPQTDKAANLLLKEKSPYRNGNV
jgi:hypothetical protein